jgi:glycine/D-amino acid oxidase-like deaminating enzyme
MASPKRIVICGGGAIGAAIAYFTSLRGAWPIVVERCEVGGAASGKSGGFLALDWCQGSPLDRLARRSFALHARLSSDLGDPWGYRRLTTYSGYAAEDNTARGPGGRPWLADGVVQICVHLLGRSRLHCRNNGDAADCCVRCPLRRRIWCWQLAATGDLELAALCGRR